MSSDEIIINVKGPSELKLQITISLDKSVKDLKVAISEKSDVEADRQRLIYSGRVLKDDDPLSTYKIQTNHTIHMVKGVSRVQPESAPAQRLPAMHAGQNPSDPLTMLNTPMAHGAMAGFNPFADMGLNPNDPNMLQNMMDSPEFLNQMSDLMTRPEFVDQMLASDPNLRNNPQMREMLQSEQFRNMVRNPEFMRSMGQMSQQLRAAGINPANPYGAGPSGLGGFPPAAGLAPTASVPGAGTPLGLGGAAPGTGMGGMPPLPTAEQLEFMRQLRGPGGGPDLFSALLGGGFPAGAGAGMGGGAPAAPVGPPPEERFQTQLQQLADMGFYNARQNVRALLATGGNVNHAIEYILGGGGAD